MTFILGPFFFSRNPLKILFSNNPLGLRLCVCVCVCVFKFQMIYMAEAEGKMFVKLRLIKVNFIINCKQTYAFYHVYIGLSLCLNMLCCLLVNNQMTVNLMTGF